LPPLGCQLCRDKGWISGDMWPFAPVYLLACAFAAPAPCATRRDHWNGRLCALWFAGGVVYLADLWL